MSRVTTEREPTYGPERLRNYGIACQPRGSWRQSSHSTQTIGVMPDTWGRGTGRRKSPRPCAGGREPQGDKRSRQTNVPGLESWMRRKAPVQFGNRWLEKYRPAILQEGLRLEKAENITSCKSREYNGNSPATKFIENPYTLIHHLSSTGERGDPLTHVPLYYRTLEDLLEDQDKRDEAVLGLSDWYPDNEETRQWFKTESPHTNYPAPGYYPSSL
jgi:hypothetical protein